MTPTILHLTIFQGVAFDPGVLRYTDSNGNAVDLTGWTPKAEARRSPCGTIAFDFVPSLSNASNGEISIAQNTARTTNFPAGRGGWDLVLAAPNGERFGPVYSGRYAVSPLNTQPETV